MMRLKLEPRAQNCAFWSYGSPVLALLLTVVNRCFSLYGAWEKTPSVGLQMFFWDPIRSGYAWGELMVKATPLLIIALGLAVCFRSNVWNIGAEGQFVVGALAAGGIALLAGKDTSRWIVFGDFVGGYGGWRGLGKHHGIFARQIQCQ